jgi:hypothetical protein
MAMGLEMWAVDWGIADSTFCVRFIAMDHGSTRAATQDAMQPLHNLLGVPVVPFGGGLILYEHLEVTGFLFRHFADSVGYGGFGRTLCCELE